MKDTIYLVVERNGVKELRKNVPNLNSGQVTIRLKVEISDKFFARFIPDVLLAIPDGAVIEPEVHVELSDKGA